MEEQLQKEWASVEGDTKVTFVVNGQEIVASRSLEKYAILLFSENNKQPGQLMASEECRARFEFKDADPKIFEQLILACYHPKIELDDCKQAINLLKLARRFEVKHIENYCISYITVNKSQLTADDVIDDH